MALVPASRERGELKQVLQAYEALLFGSAPTPAGREKVDAVKAAMGDLQSLFTDGNPSWGFAWFEAIGHTECNPVRLHLFATLLMDTHIAAAQAIRDPRLTLGL